MLRASSIDEGRPVSMVYAGLDLSRKRLDFHLLDGDGASVEVGAAPPDADGLLGLTRRLDRRLGAGRALPPRPGAGDLAARPARACRARARPLALAPGASPIELEAARA